MKNITPAKISFVTAVITALFLSILMFISSAGERLATRVSPLMHASMSIRYHASMFHMGIEKLGIDSPEIDKETIWKHLESAKMYATRILEGGSVPEGYAILPVEDENIRLITKDIINNLNVLEELSKNLIASFRNGENLAIRKKFYETISHVSKNIEKIGWALKKNIADNLGRFHTLSRVMGFFVLLSGILAFFAAARYENKREADAKVVADSEERNRSIVEASLDAIITIDNEENVVEFSRSAVKMFGYTEDEAKGRDIAELIIPPSLREKHRKSFKRYLETGKGNIIGKRVEISAIRSNGKEFPIELTVTEIKIRGRRHFTAFINDMTKRKQAENDLKAQKELFHAIASSAQDTIIMMDNRGDIAFTNEAADHMFGYDKGELIGLPLHKVIVPQRYYNDFSKGFEKFKTTGKGKLIGKVVELPAVRKDGSEFFADHSFSAVKLNGKWHSVAVIRDNTERREFENELKKAKEAADEANNYKSEFMAAMSHDLRTPLNAIMGFSEMMETHTFGPLGDPHYDEYAKDIYNSGKLLVSLINGILDLSKIEAGKYELTEEPIDVELLVDSSISLIVRQAAVKNISISTDIKPNLPMIYADDRALTQIINNFLSNAVKFTPAGGKITVSANIEDDRSIVIRVADSGIGMSHRDIIRAIEPFEQADSSQPRKHEGTGLGLYICSNLMKLHGGSMEICSMEGEGTTVTVRFPPKRTVAG